MKEKENHKKEILLEANQNIRRNENNINLDRSKYNKRRSQRS